MKTLHSLLIATLIFTFTLTLSADQNLAGNVTVTGGASTGNLSVTGAIDSDGNVLTFGTQGSTFGGALLYQDSTTDTLTFSINRTPASWLWQHNAGISAMRLNSLHDLILYQADGSTAGITLQPASNSLKLGSHASGTLTADANGAITVGGGFTVAGNFSNTNASGVTLFMGNVGIGTTSPGFVIGSGMEIERSNASATLRLQRSGDGTAAEIAAGAAQLYLGVDPENVVVGSNINFAVDGVDRVRINSAGNIGVGTTSPGAKLEVIGGANPFGLIVEGDGVSANARIALRRANAAGVSATGNIDWIGNDNLVGARIGVNDDVGGSMAFKLGGGAIGNTRLFISSAGNVGIGTTTPGLRLSVNGAIGVGPDEIPIQQTYFGYSGSYKVMRLGLDQSTRSLALNVDPTAVTGGNFSGTGQILIGNKGVLAPNAAGTDWMAVLRATGGKVYVGGSLSSGEVLGDGMVVVGSNVGIGTASPASLLEVNASAPVFTLTPSGYNGNYRTTLGTKSGAQGFLIFGNNGQNEIRAGRTVAGGYLDFFTNNTVDQFSISDGTLAMRLAANGYVGIGTTTPNEPLTIVKDGVDELGSSPRTVANFRSGNGGKGLYVGYDNNEQLATLFPQGASSGIAFWSHNGSNWGERLRVHTNGNVGIGTTNPGAFRLAVKGTIRANEVIVDTGWADYVFAEDYRLAPLAEVESHIKANKHLPGIPSAAEVAEHGVSMGDMQAKLLSKVEELTLHLIRMEKENAELRQRVQVLETASITP